MASDKDCKRAIQLLREGVFPSDWALVPVAGKSTYVTGWTKRALDRDALELQYKLNQSYRGLGVVTGDFSNGLIALDIDGPKADAKYKELAGDEYMPFGEENTWTTTSGREGRRQIFWYICDSLRAELEHVNKVIKRDDGWYLGAGDPLNKDQQKEAAESEKYEELVLRYNKCQSVLPGSPHPITKKPYWWTNNERSIMPAKGWVIDVLMQFRKPVGFLNNDKLNEIRAELNAVKDDTKASTNEMRGWFFKTSKAHAKLLEGGEKLLESLVFTPERFPLGFEWKDKGDGIHRINYCPWHGGESGTAFQYNTENGTWYCHGCGIGGDVVDFIHRRNVDNISAPKPVGMDLEIILRELSAAVEIDFESLFTQRTRDETPRGMVCSAEAFLEKAAVLVKTQRNQSLLEIELQNLITESNLFGFKPKQVVDLVRRDARYRRGDKEGFVLKPGWWDLVDRKAPVIPGWISTGCQYMVHSRGGVGKSALAMALARAVGIGETMKIRGMEMQVQQGDVLWISNDQSTAQLLDLMEEQDVKPEAATWFTLMSEWTSDQHDDLVDLIKKKRPKLVVMDSLSTVIEGEEIKGAYADYLYQLARCNGDLGSDFGFPATAFLWIHHNKKDDSDFRGSDRLQNAVDEVWSLRALNEAEEAEHGHDKRFLKVGKSRNNRSGASFKVSMDAAYTLSIEDMTPIVSRKGVNHDGEYKEDGLVLKLLAESEAPLSRPELLKLLNQEIKKNNPGSKAMSEWGIRKFLKRWLAADLITEEEEASGGGRPRRVYSSRGVRERTLSQIDLDDPNTWPRQAADWLQGAHKKYFPTESSDTPTESPETDAHRSTDGESGLFVSTANQGLFVNSPISETHSGATDSEVKTTFGEVSLFHKEAPEPPEADGLTYEDCDFDQFD